MVVHRAMLRRIYDWCIDAAHKPYALWIMGAVAFAESSFFPVPPDVMLIPMSLARPQRAWLYAAVCTATSVLGGMLGYAIGALLYDSIGHWLIEFYGLGGKVEAFRASYAEWGALIIIGKGLTPIPYKLVTITSGFAGYNIGLFVLCSIIARGGRFFVVAVLLNRYGEWIRVRIEKHLGLWVALGAAVLALGFIVALRMIYGSSFAGLPVQATFDVMLDRSGYLIASSRTHLATAGMALAMLMIATGVGWPQAVSPSSPPSSPSPSSPSVSLACRRRPSQQRRVAPPLRRSSPRRHPRRRRARKIRA